MPEGNKGDATLFAAVKGKQRVASPLNSAYGVPVFSEPTFAELEARIWKPKFDRYLTMEARQGILHDARALGHWVDIPPSISAQRYSRDEDDDKFIHTALAGAAKWLITGDLDLLVIEADLGVRIVAPAQALLMENFLPGEGAAPTGALSPSLTRDVKT